MAAACRLVAIGLGCLTAIWPALVATIRFRAANCAQSSTPSFRDANGFLRANERERSGNANAEPDRALFGRSNFAGPKASHESEIHLDADDISLRRIWQRRFGSLHMRLARSAAHRMKIGDDVYFAQDTWLNVPEGVPGPSRSLWWAMDARSAAAACFQQGI